MTVIAPETSLDMGKSRGLVAAQLGVRPDLVLDVRLDEAGGRD
jgi:hypothetical protein